VGKLHGTRQTQISTDGDTSATTKCVQYANEIPMATALFPCKCLSLPLCNLADRSEVNTEESVRKRVVRERENSRKYDNHVENSTRNETEAVEMK
jgi:hypothetical protein